MANQPEKDISELLSNSELMTQAIQQGVRDELLSHARAGNPVPVSENGEIVWLSPEEIFRRLGCALPASPLPSDGNQPAP